MIKRIAEERLNHLLKTFKSAAVIGPRQSGKTTLLKNTVDKTYISLENPDNLAFASEDPRGFLEQFPNGAILDEVQRAPFLFSYLQEILDNTKEKGLFVLSGSNNFLLQQSISQSLAGRIGYLELLPLSVKELESQNLLLPTNEQILTGFYPSIYDQKIKPTDWFPNYIATYLEKDVRQIKNVKNLGQFQRFIALLAGSTAQELNYSNLGQALGIDYKTAQEWVSILQASFIIYLLKPHFQNFKKQIVKRPKIYFNDVGLASALLGIRTTEQLQTHPAKGALFENLVVSELRKQRLNNGLPENLFYWRNKTGHEIDLIFDLAGKLTPIEIKSSKTATSDFFKNLNYYRKLSDSNNGIVLFDGDLAQSRTDGNKIMNWKKFKIDTDD